MAKKPKTAPAEEGEGADAPPKSKKKLVMIAGAAVLVLGGGAGFYVMKSRGAHADAAHARPAEEAKKPVVFLEVRELVLNLSTETQQDKAKFAKLRISLELKDAKVESEVKPLMPRVEDALQVYLRELRASDLSGSVGLYRLREELLRRVNVAVYPVKVDAVLFKDLVIQ
ncbi:flagellar basal body-associated protein FliL [Methylobacterium sp. NEAU 140]|uniref:flagellar basal body-associated protein FliL n=1 Tax=Methylobacterium sp. NEAU 140 TaxID=3064945 RepID=UPI002733AB5F|nr:flagellar basal body-associated protein FliL [Methylobacterium sp. NEAU 140]MDP4024556.1 flagellar basal body-associated protein FliL [Methylobacterium sp. NEAU 140]